MSLSFLRENPLSDTLVKPDRKTKSPPRKISKKKFCLLLAGNLIVWLCVSGFYLDITPATIKHTMRQVSKQRSIIVNGIVCNSKMQAAIIADDVYEVGDTIKGYTIVNISRHGVEFVKGEKRFVKQVTSYN